MPGVVGRRVFFLVRKSYRRISPAEGPLPLIGTKSFPSGPNSIAWAKARGSLISYTIKGYALALKKSPEAIVNSDGIHSRWVDWVRIEPKARDIKVAIGCQKPARLGDSGL